MRFFSKITVFLLICSMTLFLAAANSAAAGVNELQDSLGEGNIGENNEADAKAMASDDGVSINSKEPDKQLMEKLNKLLEEIKRVDQDIDGQPAAIASPEFGTAGEDPTIETARAKRNAIYVSMFKKAYNEFETGKYESSFASFENIYNEFNENSKALYFMTICRSKEGKSEDAVKLAAELLNIVTERVENKKLRESIDRELEDFSNTSDAELTSGQKKELNEKIGSCMRKIDKLYPAIAKIPESIKRPKDEKNAMNDKLNNVDYALACARLKKIRAAAELYKKGEYEKAYEAFAKVHDEFPLNLRTLYYMALCQKKLERPDEAAKILTKLSKIIKNRQDIKNADGDINDELETGAKDVTTGGNTANTDKNESDVTVGDISKEDMTIKVISYNIAKGQGSANNGAKFVGHRFLDEIVRLLKDEKADLIGMQEVDNNRATTGGVNQAAYIADRLKMNHFWHEASARGSNENINEHGNAVLSEHEMLKKEFVKFKTRGAGPKPMFSETRGLSYALVDFGGTKVNFISTHFGFPEHARAGQAKELVKFIKKLEGPVILTGDFNTGYSEKSQSYKIINAVLDNAYDKAKVRGGKNGVAPHRNFIDFVFATPGVFSCESVCLGGKEYEGASDHKPNITVLKFKNK